MEDQIRGIERAALSEIESCTDKKMLETLRIKYLGKKGKLTSLLRGMGALPPADRPRIGNLVNQAKTRLQARFTEALEQYEEAERQRAIANEYTDITLPGRRFWLGRKHPLQQTFDEIREIFFGMGFSVAEGPDVELEAYNFDKLNFPPEHPARDMQDTFYVQDDVILRTHTSPVQARVMEKQHPPVRIIVPGRVYRTDEVDPSHSPVFHQVEGLYVDRRVTMGDLKGVLTEFIHQMFGPTTQLRFRPSFFPFTEPSAEVDMTCIFCQGSGCNVCKQKGWLEILGSGMVDPNVFAAVGYNPEEWTGFAFGMGVERIAMLKYNINDMRLLYTNDLRFLEQF
ncbi:MAG: phenylalanine--tRNA ligase subunit alpha [Gemmatimonadetes bacterium]|nr:MAG: phenylalanine--tRNA ligase subunit alpha [Gemmatimonadota bacterium]